MPNTYTEREVAQIIERAVVRQEEARRRQGAAGLSIEEIERLGEDVGIDPEFLRLAAAEIDAGAGEKESHTTATHNHVERWTAGPLDPIDWEDAVDDLRQRLGTDYGAMYGRTSAHEFKEQGATKTWEHTSGLGVHHRVTVSERGERTRIRLEQQVGIMSPPAEGIMYSIFSMLLLGPLAAFIGTSVLNGVLATVASVAMGLVFFVVAAYAIYKADIAWREKKHRQLEELADDLAMQLAPAAPARSAAPEASGDVAEQAPNAPRLDLDALGGADASAPARRRRDRA
ncbi:MAG: hypothetical protein AAFQ43_14540 [Bacteroidota bacterium]